MTAQTQINKMQTTYKQWLDLQAKLEQTKHDLANSVKLMKTLEDFYFEGDWRELSEQIDNGVALDLTTDGEYSVMGEDTIWNAFHEHQALMWDFLRTATKALDKDNPSFYAQEADNQTGNQTDNQAD